jgi:hypothetical protein
MAWVLSTILVPAARTRFFIVLIEVIKINNIKRAQTILASGLKSLPFYYLSKDYYN